MEARAYVDKGWCQNSLYEVENDNKVGWCLVGALVDATNDAEQRAQAGVLFARASDISKWSLVPWNNAPGRTKEDVLEAFDRAISLGLREAGDR